jgi:hypothetical protein
MVAIVAPSIIEPPASSFQRLAATSQEMAMASEPTKTKLKAEG